MNPCFAGFCVGFKTCSVNISAHPISHLSTPCSSQLLAWGRPGCKGIQSTDRFVPSPTLCSADPLGDPAGTRYPVPSLCLPPGGLLASTTLLLPTAGAAAFLADLQGAQMHLINKECTVLQEGCGMAVRGWEGWMRREPREAGRSSPGLMVRQG